MHSFFSLFECIPFISYISLIINEAILFNFHSIFMILMLKCHLCSYFSMLLRCSIRNYTLLEGVVMVGSCLMFRYSACPFIYSCWSSLFWVMCNLLSLQVFDLISLAWSNLRLEMELDADKTEDSGLLEVLPPMSDHCMVCSYVLKIHVCALPRALLFFCLISMCSLSNSLKLSIISYMYYFWQVKWGTKLLILGGHSKKSSDSMIGLFLLEPSWFWSNEHLVSFEPLDVVLYMVHNQTHSVSTNFLQCVSLILKQTSVVSRRPREKFR